jgi:hypothetical protein
LAKIHKHKTIDALPLGAAAALALATTAGTRQNQVNNLTPDAAADSVIWADGPGFYIRLNANGGQDKYGPAYTLEEASRWDSGVIQAVQDDVTADMMKDGLEQEDVDSFGLRSMTYADALVQERDVLDTDDRYTDGDPSGVGDDDPRVQQLFGKSAA